MARVLPDGVHDSPDGYENLTRIGQGGFAVVYRALDTRFDRTVALKILRSDSLNERQLGRFNAECLATGRASSHPNIVTVYDAGTTAGHRPWLAMEHCSGGSLAQKVARLGPLPVAEVLSVGARLCSALSAAHDAGILHRDVKPHNVLLTSYGEPALADFGIASVGVEDGSATETAAYTVVHAAPEILEGRAATTAADIYSLGSTLYTLLAGQAPYAAEAGIGLAPLVTRILRNDLPPIARPGAPPELEQLLRQCMAALPLDRPACAAELGEQLAALADGLATDPTVTGPGDLAGSAAIPAARPAARPKDQPAAVSPAVSARSVAGPATGSAGGDADSAAVAPISARRLLLSLGGVLGVLLAAFMFWGPGKQDPGPESVGSNVAADVADLRIGGMAQAAQKYLPRDLAVAQGARTGEMTVTWRMPVRPDVVATVVYEGTGSSPRARAVVSYSSARAVPRATLRGLPSAQRVCLSVAHVVSVDDKVTNALSPPMCTEPR